MNRYLMAMLFVVVLIQQVSGITINTYSSYTHDFGTIIKYDENTSINLLLNLYNNQKITYEIKEINKSCGCTHAEIEDKKIPPKAKCEINLDLDITNKDGFIMERVLLIPKISSLSTTAIYLKANIKPVLTLSKSKINFGTMHYTEAKTEKIGLLFSKESNVIFQKAYLLINKSMDVRSIEKNKNTWEIILQKKPEKLVRGEVKNNLIIQYSHNGLTYKKIVPVNYFINGDVRFAPNRLFYGFLKNKDKVSREVSFTHFYNKPLKIKKYSSDNSDLRIQIINEPQNMKIKMVVTPVILKTGFIKGNINVEFDDPKEIINIPIIGYVKK